jgi:putative phosphoribosyl transferase
MRDSKPAGTKGTFCHEKVWFNERLQVLTPFRYRRIKARTMFRNRIDAGNRLAARLFQYKNRLDATVLALPRGGVVIGYEIARALNAPLDVLIVRKIRFPGQPELAIGAVAETGSIVLNESIVAEARLSEDILKPEIEHQKEEIARRMAIYRAGKAFPPLDGMVAILVDDGVATGATIRAAISALKEQKVAKLVLALPVGPPETVKVLRQLVDELICLETPLDFMAVSVHYLDFTQVSDNEAMDLLQKLAAKAA